MKQRPILLIRGGSEQRDELALQKMGIEFVSEPFTHISAGSSKDAAHLLNAVQIPHSWLIAISRNAIGFWDTLLNPPTLQEAIRSNHTLNFAAIGEGSKSSLLTLGANRVQSGEESDSQGLLKYLSGKEPSTAIIPGGNLAHSILPEGLEKAGWKVITGVVYLNEPVKEVPKVVAEIRAGKFSLIVVRSPSAVRALNQFSPHCETPLLCGGKLTLAQAKELKLPIATYSDDPSPEAIATLVKNYQESEVR